MNAPGPASADLPARASHVRVDLGAIAGNVRALAAIVRPAALFAVVKADAYGHGAAKVAAQALAAGAHALCVALPQEAMELRRAGIEAPLLVLGPTDADEMAALGAAGVAVTLTDGPSVVRARAAASRLPARTRPLGVHLKVDTGMGRIGCRPEEAPDLARAVADAADLVLLGVFTHFASADEDAAATRGQLARFVAARAAIEARLDGAARPLWHAANSAGALALPEARLDAVRTGIALYGYPALPSGVPAPAALRPALSVLSRVSFVKRVATGFAVSYGSTYRTAGERTLATLPLGYADGLRRGLGGMEVVVAGRRVPIVGRVTMDQVVVEGPDDWPVAFGDPAVLLDAGGEGPTAAEWAARLATIPYEVLTGLSTRLPRRYAEGEPAAAGPGEASRAEA